jgi:hypothetical protein
MIAILLSTCDAYEEIAHFTFKQLDICWKGHPPVFVCGLNRRSFTKGQQLPFSGDSRDWVGIIIQAVDELQARGVEWFYLILDDHPPFGPCNEDYLNLALPATAERVNAIQVNLLGWDQFQPQSGDILDGKLLHWQCNKPDFPWKFSLHPGFWHTETLGLLLRQFRKTSPAATAARAFEGLADTACRSLNPSLCTQTYRIRGDGYTARRGWFEHRNTRMMIRFCIHLIRGGTRLAGEKALKRVDERLLPYLGYLNGPYPMFWSGLVRQGRLHEHALRFLEWIGRRDLVREIRHLKLSGSA